MGLASHQSQARDWPKIEAERFQVPEKTDFGPQMRRPPDLSLNLNLATGTLLLEIRKSVGNEKTDLHYFEMLEFLITDIRSKYQKDGKY